MDALRKSNGQFEVGWRGGPGRQLGARARLREAVVAAVERHWNEHGDAALDRMAQEFPQLYVAGVLSLLPKEAVIAHVSPSPFEHLSDKEFEEMERLEIEARDRTAQQIEAVAIEHADEAIELEPKDATQVVE